MQALILEIAGLVTAITVIITATSKVFNKALKEKLDPIEETIKKTNKQINILDEGHCKDFLLGFLSAIERGEKIDEAEYTRAYEVYDHYTNDLKKNSYIHDRWEKVMGHRR